MAKSTARTIYWPNGPNLNLLGTWEPHIYGRSSLKDVEKLCRKTADTHGFAVEFRQSNHEGVIVDWIQEAGAKKAVGIVFNPGGLTHTSVSCHDAIKGISIPTIECHISNIHARCPAARPRRSRQASRRRYLADGGHRVSRRRPGFGAVRRSRQQGGGRRDAAHHRGDEDHESDPGAPLGHRDANPDRGRPAG